MKMSDLLLSVAGTGMALCALCWWCLIVVATARYFVEYWRDRQFGMMALGGGLLVLFGFVSLLAIATVLRAFGA